MVSKSKIKCGPNRSPYFNSTTSVDNLKSKYDIRVLHKIHESERRHFHPILNQTHYLKDVIEPNLDLLIIGFNPGYVSAEKGHHYAGPSNHMWPALYYSGLLSQPLICEHEMEAVKNCIGFTNIVERPTRGSSDISKSEMKNGAEILRNKILKYKPKIAAFNGKGIYEVFSGEKKFYFGKQISTIGSTILYVMPSSSARCSQLPRLEDKLPYFLTLKKLLDHINGKCVVVDDTIFTFQHTNLTRNNRKRKLT